MYQILDVDPKNISEDITTFSSTTVIYQYPMTNACVYRQRVAIGDWTTYVFA